MGASSGGLAPAGGATGGAGPACRGHDGGNASHGHWHGGWSLIITVAPVRITGILPSRYSGARPAALRLALSQIPTAARISSVQVTPSRMQCQCGIDSTGRGLSK